MKIASISVVALAFLGGPFSLGASAQQAKKPFTVADDIGLTLFSNPNGTKTEAALFSPDGRYLAVRSERGRLDVNLVEDSISFYRSEDIKNFLAGGEESRRPAAFWIVTRSCKEAEDTVGGEDGAIRHWRWMANSEGMAFLASAKNGAWQLTLADLHSKKLEVLTPETVSVAFFDTRDRQHYVYTATQMSGEKLSDTQAPAKVATGHKIRELFFPDDPLNRIYRPAYLWAVAGDRPFQVKKDGTNVIPELGFPLALSPDGESVATVVNVPQVPSSWEKLYPPPYPSADWRIHAGKSAAQFVRVALKAGSIQSLTDAPISASGGAWEDVPMGAEWSRDGQSILLPGTYLRAKDDASSRPCVAVVDLASNSRSCVEVLKWETETSHEAGYHNISNAEFVDGKKDQVLVTFTRSDLSIAGTTEYTRANDGTWRVTSQGVGEPKAWHDGLRVTVKEDLNVPPVLVASNKETSRVIWDPNPQLKSFDLGEVSLYRWKDKDGREIEGNLYKPANYQMGRHYPLVIQTHGKTADRFMPSGNYTTGFAAQEMAAAGIAVLQVLERCVIGGESPKEGPCAISVYESALNQLTIEGLVDPEKVGLIGFSHTCFYVMETLTMSATLHLRAASVNDGYLNDYFQFMMDPSPGKSEPWNGGPPFGDGLQLWLKHSPSFNLDKVHAPLLLMAASGGYQSAGLFMWGPYAGLYSLKKPVDLILLNSNEHGITNPAERLVSQGTNVDWFRFWLTGEEDPDPTKAEQYKRWHGLRELQAENEKKSGGAQAASN